MIWNNSDPKCKNLLPKVIFRKNTERLIDIMNKEIITQYITKESNLE